MTGPAVAARTLRGVNPKEHLRCTNCHRRWVSKRTHLVEIHLLQLRPRKASEFRDCYAVTLNGFRSARAWRGYICWAPRIMCAGSCGCMPVS